MSYLGIDLGTSGLRALLMGQGGEVLGSAEAHYSTAHPHAGWSEQDPALWITALEQAVAHLRRDHPAFADLRGIGVSGHMHGAVLLDASGDVLRPCILWNDTRAHAEAAALDANPVMRAGSGNIVFAGFTAPKLDWVKTHEPKIYAQVAKVLLPAAYLNYYLTGEYVGDLSDAIGTSWCDVHRREWSEDLLTASGMRRDQMPRLVEGGDAAGMLRTELAHSWGVGAVTVAGGAGDNAAAACGIGAVEEGAGFVSLGTSGVVLIARETCAPMPETAVHTFCHAVGQRWFQMGVMLAATDSLNWLSRIVGATPSELSAELGAALRAPSDIQFHPYLSGERTPHNDASLRGGFAGLSIATTRQDMTQAVLEGVSFGLRDCLEALRQTGADPQELFVIGGGAQSGYWRTLLATILGIPLRVPAGAEFGAALGAARLGQAAVTGAGVSLMSAPQTEETVLPDPALQPRFEVAYQAWRRETAKLTKL